MSDDFKLNDETLSEALTLPSNREAEEALIGAVLINAASITSVRPVSPLTW